MSQSPVHYSSASNEWETPQHIFDILDREFAFTLDPCATAENAKCKKFYTLADDGLSKLWASERVFMNPPYGLDICDWIKKAYDETLGGALVVCLIPARTDTAYWHNYVMNADEIRFVRGRIKFLSNGACVNSAPFPSAVVVFASPNEWLNYASITSVSYGQGE